MAAICLPETEVHLIESRGKKCAFLEHVASELDMAGRVRVHNERIEAMTGPKADIISARACANLAKLFDWGHRFQAQNSLWILPKGRSAADELDDAKRAYTFDCRAMDSRTDPEAKILLVRDVKWRRQPTSGVRAKGRKRPDGGGRRK